MKKILRQVLVTSVSRRKINLVYMYKNIYITHISMPNEKRCHIKFINMPDQSEKVHVKSSN